MREFTPISVICVFAILSTDFETFEARNMKFGIEIVTGTFAFCERYELKEELKEHYALCRNFKCARIT
jgi:hypothetical protein